MLMFIEIWHRRKPGATYRRHGPEQVAALLEAGATMTLKVNATACQVTVDRSARTAISTAAVSTPGD